MKKFLSLVLALVMTMSLVTISAGAKDFTDDSKITYEEAVDVMTAVGVVGGYADGSFNPTAGLTRGAAAKIICNMILGPTTASALNADAAPYKDVPVDNTFAGYIAFCAKEGIISGYADGTFRPAAPLTGYAFMKMLLGALGYDAAIEGYTGSNWSINVAKRALNIGLDDGLVDEFVGSKALTREEACLYAFNTLNTEMVEYETKGSQITINGVVISSGASEAKKVVESDKNNVVDYLLFREQYFGKLKTVPSKNEDDFGRPATTWKVGKDEVGTYANTADASYTKKVDGKTLYEDLGLDANIDTVKEIEDGVDQKSSKTITKKDEKTEFGANGVLTEVYLQKDKDDEITGAIVVEINTYVGKVNDIDENDDDERIIVLDSGETYKTEEFEEKDIVLYTVAGAKKEVKSVELAEKQTGKVTKTVGSKYTIDGEVYSLSANKEVEGKVAVKKDVDFYLDSYGYIIKMDLTSDDVTVDDLAYVLDTKGDGFDGYRAKLLFADGSKKTVDLDKEYKNVKGTIVSFDVNDDGEYELTDANTTAGTVTNGSPVFTKSDVANSKTVYVYYLTDKDGDTFVKTYTSYKNAPTVKKGTVVGYVDDNKVEVVFVIAAEADVDFASSNDDLTFVSVDASADITNDGDNKYYTFSAVVDGKVTTLDVEVDAVKSITADTVVATKNVTSKDGIVTSLGSFETLSSAKTVSVSDEVIKLDGAAKAYTDDVLVLFVDDNEFTVGSIGGIKDSTATKVVYSAIQYTTDKEKVDVIVLTKK